MMLLLWIYDYYDKQSLQTKSSAHLSRNSKTGLHGGLWYKRNILIINVGTHEHVQNGSKLFTPQ